MNYNIKGTAVAVTPELRAYAERVLAHADKFLKGDATAYANIELEHAALRAGGQYRAEFTVSASGATYRAEIWGNGLHEAMDVCAGELVHELRRAKDRRLHLFRRGAAKIKNYLRGWSGE